MVRRSDGYVVFEGGRTGRESVGSNMRGEVSLTKDIVIVTRDSLFAKHGSSAFDAEGATRNAGVQHLAEIMVPHGIIPGKMRK